MKHMKKAKVLWITLLLLIIFSTTILASQMISNLLRNDSLLSENDINNNQAESTLINIQDSIDMDEIYILAVKNSTKMVQVNYDLEQAKFQFEDVEYLKDIDSTKGVPVIDPATGQVMMMAAPDSELQMKISKDIVYFQAKNGVELAKKRVEMEQQNLHNQVTTLLINYTKAEEGLTLAKANLERTQKLMDMTNAQYEQGLIARSQVLDSEVALSQAENGVKGAEVQYKIARDDVLAAIGIEDFEGLKIETLTPDNEYTDMNEEALEDALGFAYGHRIDYLMQEDNTNYEKKRFEIYKEHYTFYGNQTDKIRSQEIVYEKQKLNLLDAKRNLRSQVYKTILGYNNAVNSLGSLEKNVEKATESLRIAELRYDAGLSTALEVISAQVNLQQAENQLLDGKYNIMNMKNNLESAMGGTMEAYQKFIEADPTEE